MRRKRRLKDAEVLMVDESITQICIEEGLNPSDDLYRSAAWASFMECYQHYDCLWDPDFWPWTFERVAGAIRFDKQLRTFRLYRELSLDRRISPEGDEVFLDRIPAKNGDFTNGVVFFDFIAGLPLELRQLSSHILHGYTLEEARSRLKWTSCELVQQVDNLRKALCDYEEL